MSFGAEVRIKLSGDDTLAQAAIARVHKGFSGIHEGVSKGFDKAFGAVKRFGSGMLQGAGMAAFASATSSVENFVSELMNAPKAAAAQQRAIASALAMTDQTGASFEQLKARAGPLRQEFMEMGIKAGVMAGDVVQAFTEIAERSNKPTEEVKKLTEQILQAGKVTGDIEPLTRGMRMLEAGMVSNRNPIVAMIRSTGVLKGSIHEVAAQLQKMTPEGQMNAGEEAIKRLASKAAGMKPTFAQLANNMRQMKENILEDIGGPLIQGIMPALMDVQKWIAGHRKEIEHYAHVIGTKVGEWVKGAAKAMADAFRFLQTHAAEIKDALAFGAGAVKSAVAFLLQHKEVIVAMLTVKGLPGGLGGMPGQAVAAVGVGVAIGREVGKAIFNANNQHTDLASVDFMKSITDKSKVLAEKGDTAGIQSLFKEAAAEAKANGARFQYAGQDFLHNLESIMQSHFARALDVEKENKRQESLHQFGVFKDHIKGAFDTFNAGKTGVVDQGVGPRSAAADQMRIGEELGAAYNQAASINSTYGQGLVSNILAGSHNMRAALVEAGTVTGEGFASLVEQVAAISSEAAKDLSSLFKEHEARAKPTFQQNFSGGQTFNITQDLRKANPDEIALVSRKDVFRRALARGFASTGTPFGG